MCFRLKNEKIPKIGGKNAENMRLKSKNDPGGKKMSAGSKFTP